MSQPARDPDPDLTLMRGEMWLARRLGKHGVLLVFGGTTSSKERMQRMREKIKTAGLELIICGHKDGKPVRYGEAFERLYGVKL